MLTKEQQTLVKFIFWTHPQTLTMEGIAQQMHFSRRTFYRKKDEVLVMLGDVSQSVMNLFRTLLFFRIESEKNMF
ncbi:hypothetical protein BFR40_01715 [Brochothrix thermosphacta]|nr:hypothetical protein BFR40_01715 [Brochothrix thermosphacta]